VDKMRISKFNKYTWLFYGHSRAFRFNDIKVANNCVVLLFNSKPVKYLDLGKKIQVYALWRKAKTIVTSDGMLNDL
jgi:hypothetical protein